MAAPNTRCPNGHLYTDTSSYIERQRKAGERIEVRRCKVCRALRRARHQKAARQAHANTPPWVPPEKR